MALVLTRGVPGLDSLQPLAPEPNAPPPAPLPINTYSPNVERYRQLAWDEMPDSIKNRPDAAVQLDKFLHTMTWESGGNSESALDPGSDGATGVMRIQNLAGRPSPQALMDPATNIRYAWGLIKRDPDTWTDYGEGGATYDGKPFGALSQHPYGSGAPAYDPNAAPIVSRVMIDPLSTHLSEGQTSGFPAPRMPFSPYQPAPDPWQEPVGQIAAGEAGMQAPYDQQTGPNLLGGGINPNQGGFRNTEMLPDPNATTDDLFGALERGTRIADIPYARQAADSLGQGVGAATESVIGGGPIYPIVRRAVSAAGGPDLPSISAPDVAARLARGATGAPIPEPSQFAEDAARQSVPTNVRDAALTALPLVGPAREGATALRGAAERFATEGLGAEAGRAPEAIAGVAGSAAPRRLNFPADLGLEGAALSSEEQLARAKQMYQRLRAEGNSHEDIVSAWGQEAADRAGGIDTTAQRNATHASASDAAAHAAKRVYANTLDATGDLDAASAAARKAAAAASQGIQDQVKPNLLASDDTAAQMAAARGRVRETPTESVAEATPATTMPEGTPAGGTSTNAPTPVTTTISDDAKAQLRAQGLTDEEIDGIASNAAAKPASVPGEAEAFNQARQEAIAKAAEARGIKPEEMSFEDRAAATAEVVKRLNKAKPGQEVGDALAQAKRVERIADASQAFAVPPEQPTLQQALEMTQGQMFTPPTDNPNAGQLALGGQGGQMGIGEARAIPAGETPPAGPSLNTQRLNRGLTEPAGFAGTGDVIPPPKNPGVNAQGEFGKDFTPGPGYKESLAHRAYRELLSLVNSPIRVVTYGHEPIFRQGVGFALTHPSAAREALANMVAVARNPEAAAALNEALNAKPWVKAAMDAGWLHEGARPPETFINNLINKIPGMRNSGESARIYLTTLRKMGYEQEAQRLWQMGVKDPEEYKSLWNTVSDVTGHGLRGQSIAVGGINPVFSPQAMVGRFRGLLDPFLEKGAFNPLAPGARSVAIRNLIGIGGMAAGIEGIAKASGLNLKWGLLDTPLGKVEVGPSTIDPTAGYASIIRMGARAFDAAQSGDLSKLKDTATGYLRGQLGPTVDTMVSTFTGQDWQGKDFNLIQRAQSGQLVRDLYEPIAARAIEDAVKANGPIGALIAAPSMGAMGVETNLLQAARDKATERLSNGAVKSYEEAKGQPLLKQQVDRDASVIEAKGSPTQYQQTADQLHKPTIDEVARQEDLFSKGQNGKKLSDVYHDAGIENRKTAEALTEQYGDQFKGIPQSAQQKLLQDYYAIDKKLPDDAATDAGGHDYEATDAARQDFVAALPADQQQFIKEALQASENNKTPLHQEYDKYIADKKAAGYFATHVDPKSGQTVGLSAKERTALDVAHPELDVAAWKFGSVGGNAGSSLNSREAVTQALASPDAKNKAVTFAGLKRPINQSPDTLAMWKYSGPNLDWYMNQLPNGKDAANEAKRLAGSTGDKEYAKPLDQMDSKHRSVVTGNLHQAALAGSPELEAFLYVWGERTTLTTQAASDKAGQLIKQYHLNDVKAPIKKAA